VVDCACRSVVTELHKLASSVIVHLINFREKISQWKQNLTPSRADLPKIEDACISGLSMICPRYRGNEWFRGSLQDARRVIEDVLSSGQLSYIEPSSMSKPKKVIALRHDAN
jgi:hypothetical protein